MKKWLLTQLSQASTWIGLAVIVASIIAPREYIMYLGVALMVIKDEAIKQWVTKIAPDLSKAIANFFGEE